MIVIDLIKESVVSNDRSTQSFHLVRALKKSFVSMFVIFTFTAYAIHQHFDGQNETSAATQPIPPTYVGQQVKPDAPPIALAERQPTALPTQKPSAMATKPPATTAPTSAPPTTVPPTAEPTSARAVVPPTATAPASAKPAPIAQAAGQYKDGAYTGPSVNAYWGQVQVRAVVQNGQIAKVDILDYPADRRTSQRINSYAIPYLQQETIQAQSARVNAVSGATLTSQAYMQSLQSALNSARSGA